MADKVNKDITNGFWEMSSWENLRRGYCLIEGVSMAKVSAGDLHSGKCQSMNCIGKRSYNQV